MTLKGLVSIGVVDQPCYFINVFSNCTQQSQAGELLVGTIVPGASTTTTQYYICVCSYVNNLWQMRPISGQTQPFPPGTGFGKCLHIRQFHTIRAYVNLTAFSRSHTGTYSASSVVGFTPTTIPTRIPTTSPPTSYPTLRPTTPTFQPSKAPSDTDVPTSIPTAPTFQPTSRPT